MYNKQLIIYFRNYIIIFNPVQQFALFLCSANALKMHYGA